MLGPMLSKDEVIAALSNVGDVPDFGRRKGRSIYEATGPRGHFHIDYAAFTGGRTEEVPRNIIDELEREGIISRTFPDSPISSWSLKKQL
jgi:hypothetical protein